MGGVRNDKARDATDGYDGGWVAHPGLVDLAMAEFKKVLGDAPNQISKQRPDIEVTAKDLLNFQPETPITEAVCVTTSTSVFITSVHGWQAMVAYRFI
jgi:malate synthase